MSARRAIEVCADWEGLKLNISETDNAQELDLVREVAPFFRVKPSRVAKILDEVVAAVRTWPDVASSQGLGRMAQERMSRAFRLVGGVG